MCQVQIVYLVNKFFRRGGGGLEYLSPEEISLISTDRSGREFDKSPGNNLQDVCTGGELIRNPKCLPCLPQRDDADRAKMS